MIVLYSVVPSPRPDDPSWPGIVITQADEVPRFHDSESSARTHAGRLAELIGPRPQPGIQHTRPIPISVVELTFKSVLSVYRRSHESAQRVWTISSLADGSVIGGDESKRQEGRP